MLTIGTFCMNFLTLIWSESKPKDCNNLDLFFFLSLIVHFEKNLKVMQEWWQSGSKEPAALHIRGLEREQQVGSETKPQQGLLLSQILRTTHTVLSHQVSWFDLN